MALSLDTTIGGTGFIIAEVANQTNPVTASFSTAANVRLVALCASNSGSDTAAENHTVSGAGLSWSKEVTSGEDIDGQAPITIWVAYSATALTDQTVTCARGGDGNGDGASLVVVGLLGAEQTHGGAENTSSSDSGLASVGLTTTRAGSYVFATSGDWSQQGDYNIDGTQSPAGTLLNTHNISGQYSAGQWRTTNTVAASTAVTMAGTINTRDHHTGAIEIREVEDTWTPETDADETLRVLSGRRW